MGAAASLFYDASDSEKQTLYRRIIPSEEQFDEQQERWNALAEYLISDLRDQSGYPIRTWLQGSYKFGTQIRPVRLNEEFDIDLGVYFEWAGDPQDGDHTPKGLKGFVQGSLRTYADDNSDDVLEISSPKPRCCRIRFKNNFHIDVPGYHLDQERDERCLATEVGWEESDPKAIYLWFRDSFDEASRTKVRRHVRYLKSWSALKFQENDGRPASILLTVLVADAAALVGAGNVGADDDALRDLLEKIVDRLESDPSVPNPVNTSENLVRLSESQINTLILRLKRFSDIADRATGKETQLSAADVWQEAFEHLFPMPEAATALTDAAMNLPVPFTMPEIRVTAVSRNNAASQFSGANRIGPIPKNCDIRFEITNPYTLPPNSTVHWMVRNEGREAEHINDLGHNAGTGLSAKEHSAYRGTHHMDCVVRIAGEPVAMRRVPVTISGIEAPRRNPARPSWTKLRGRR